ncbi:MAG: PaaI family thioesterase [Promethearchaeota archaeon]|nr:MAG: PaaI family thioesterase [Candidatus Lokiarchaeota archaeon]
MNKKYFQDIWADEMSYCFGCGRNNDQGLRIKSYWDGDEAICIWTPEEHHKAAENVLCGGIIATLIDCHCLNTVTATIAKKEGREKDDQIIFPYATGSIHIDLLKATPLNSPVELRAKVTKILEKKIFVKCSLFSKGIECVRGEIVAVKVPENFWKKGSSN